jgi:hypothetical protein
MAMHAALLGVLYVVELIERWELNIFAGWGEALEKNLLIPSIVYADAGTF